MYIEKIEHVYTVTGKDVEVLQFKRELQEKYEEVELYQSPFDHRVVCRYRKGAESNELCPVYDGTVLPDEDGMCSLCGKHSASIAA